MVELSKDAASSCLKYRTYIVSPLQPSRSFSWVGCHCITWTLEGVVDSTSFICNTFVIIKLSNCYLTQCHNDIFVINLIEVVENYSLC